MKKNWNYLFYCTWKLQILIGNLLIEKPLLLIFSQIPFLKRRWEKVKKYYEKQMYDIDNGFDVGFAFSFMVFSTSLLLAGLILIVNYLLNFDAQNFLRVYFWSVILASILINFLFLYLKDTYKNYFLTFGEKKVPRKNYLIAICFHLGVLVWCILSIYFTIGFNI